MADNPTEVVLTREELYERVWSTPMHKLASEFGLSDVGLAKVCKRYKIPKPTRGYWVKLECGKEVSKWPLMKLDDESLSRIHFRQNTPSVITKEKPPPAVDPEIAARNSGIRTRKQDRGSLGPSWCRPNCRRNT